jgi:hypothetical protein
MDADATYGPSRHFDAAQQPRRATILFTDVVDSPKQAASEMG